MPPHHAAICIDNPVVYPQHSRRVNYTHSNPSWVNPKADIYVVHRPQAVCQYLMIVRITDDDCLNTKFPFKHFDFKNLYEYNLTHYFGPLCRCFYQPLVDTSIELNQPRYSFTALELFSYKQASTHPFQYAVRTQVFALDNIYSFN